MGGRQLLGAGCGEPSPRTCQHDPRPALDSRDHHRRHIRRNSTKLNIGRNEKRAPTDSHGDYCHTGDPLFLPWRCLLSMRSCLRLMLRCCASHALSKWGDSIPGTRKLTNLAREGFSGHHYVIMALCSSLAAFLVNGLFALGRTSKARQSPGSSQRTEISLKTSREDPSRFIVSRCQAKSEDSG